MKKEIKEIKESVRVRYPPSPTGKMHIGNTRTFLTAFLTKEIAKKEGKNGVAVMRFEDTDRERSEKKFEDFILKTLDTLGITFEEGPFRQSERTDRYVEIINLLIENNLAYEGEESKDGSGEKVIRFKNPNKKVTFNDIIRGDIIIETTDFGDFPIARSKTNPLYLLTVVVDDIDMEITHIHRGEDHITTTPRNILLFEAIGKVLEKEIKIPKFAHLPLIIGDDKKKLGKRHGAVTWEEFENLGYLPDAVINHLALLGWHPKKGSEKEIFSKEELIEEFKLEDVSKSPARFDYKKLDDINRAWMLKLFENDKKNKTQFYKDKVLEFLSLEMKKNFEKDEKKADLIIDKIISEKINKFSEITEMEKNGDFEYLFEKPKVSDEQIIFKNCEISQSKDFLKQILNKIENFSEENWNAQNIKEILWDWSGEVGRGNVLHPMRMSLSGAQRSPDPFLLSEILGKNETLKRLKEKV